MKRIALLLIVFLAATAPLAAQGPGRAGLSAPPIQVHTFRTSTAGASPSSGMTRTERGALIGAIVGAVAGAVLISLGNEKGFGNSVLAGVVLAIPVSFLGALIGSM